MSNNPLKLGYKAETTLPQKSIHDNSHTTRIHYFVFKESYQNVRSRFCERCPGDCIPYEIFPRVPIKTVTDITSGTGIAACNSGSRLRVYMQDVMGNIRETLYENGWSNGTEKNVIATAKHGSPIAATSKELNNVRIFILVMGHRIAHPVADSRLLYVVRQHAQGSSL